jgi:hypothetical protein
VTSSDTNTHKPKAAARILSVGRDGCWVESLEPRPADRRRCTIRHEAILPPDEPDEPDE